MNRAESCNTRGRIEGRKRVLGIMAAILASLHMQTADDLFGGPQGTPRVTSLIGLQFGLQFDGLKRSCGRFDRVFPE